MFPACGIILRFNPRARGGRDVLDNRFPANFMFQSTRPRGARQSIDACLSWLEVSIHAPAGGATPTPAVPVTIGCFNPRARGGRDIFRHDMLMRFWFQSTRPRGARPYFQTRKAQKHVSIHAPAGGATLCSCFCSPFYCFNPRARGGRDHATINDFGIF